MPIMRFLPCRVRPAAVLAAVLAGLATAACDQPGAYGDANALIVATTPAIWQELEDTLQTALEPQIFTVTRERAFRVTYQDPEAEGWGQLKHFRQVILFGDREDPWVAEALGKAGRRTEIPEPPGIVEVQNVWSARDQLVTVVLLPPDAGAEAAFMVLCDEAGVPCQKYVHRNDIPCGTTIGPITGASLGVRTVDVGNPMWSMHSIRESAGALDHERMIAVMRRFLTRPVLPSPKVR
jgi:hypothetical protein